MSEATHVESRRLRLQPLRLSLPGASPSAAWLLPFALVLYLALEGGGYDPLVRGQVGVALWWIVLLASAVGVIPRARIGALGWAAVALIVAFAAWTGLSTTWSESEERSVGEFAKVAMYAAVLVLAIAATGRDGARHALNGLTCAVGLVAVLAVGSRLQPQLFPSVTIAEVFGEGAARRLSYPLNYWNAVAAVIAVGLPLVLHAAGAARTLSMQAVAAATVPMMSLGVFLTVSRGGVLAVVAAVLAWVLLRPNRLIALATLVPAATGSALLIAGADQRDALQAGLLDEAHRSQGDEMLAMVIVVAGGVGLIQLAIALVGRHVERPHWTFVSRRGAAIGAVLALTVFAVAAVAAGAPGTVEREWKEFKQLHPPAHVEGGEDTFARLRSISGNGRYDLWKSAADANETRPASGIGAGTFEYWWARNATFTGGFLRDAHSLYMETLGELGIVGLVLIAALFALALTAGISGALRRGAAGRRAEIAAATAALIAFLVMAGGEWIWEIPAVAAAALILVAVLLSRHTGPSGGGRLQRVALALLATAGLVTVGLPLAGATSIRESEAAVGVGNLTDGLERARTAAKLQPYAATPRLQQALILERAGLLARAQTEAVAATEREPTNWRTWLILSRIQAKRGDARAAVRSFRRARALNPRSQIFLRP